jgi:hypothetical protein
MYGNLGQHIREQIQTCHPKGKTFIEMLNWESLFILSRLSSCRSTNSPVGVNPHGSAEKVKLLLNSSHLEPQVMKPPHHRGDDDSE